MMKTSKRWIPSLRTESEEFIDKITWNSSSSSENESHSPKRRKFEFTALSPADNEVPSSPVLHKGNSFILLEVESSDLSILTASSVQQRENSPVLESPSFKYSNLRSESPILSRPFEHSNLESASPVLSSHEMSPILDGSDRIKNKIKTHVEEYNITLCKLKSSPDLFVSQATQNIEVNDSPDLVSYKTENTQQCDKNNSVNIDLVSSQESSKFICTDFSRNTSNSSSTTATSDITNSYHFPYQKRKNFKKGSLAYQLHNALQLQKSRTSIWHHDIFCEKINLSENNHVTCLINKIWNDFGCLMLICNELTKDRFPMQKLIVCLGHNVKSQETFKNGEVITIYAPFKEKLVQYCDESTRLFYNISRIITEDNKIK